MALTKATNRMISGAVVNALDYNADPTGVADSTTALQNALNSGAKNVYLPSGTYKTTATLTRPNLVRIFGDGPVESQIVASHNNTIIKTGASPTLTGDGYNSIERIGFKNAATYNSSIGIELNYLNQPCLRDIRVEDGPAIGIQCVFVLNGRFENISVSDCTTAGIYLYSTGLGTGTNRNVFQNINSIYDAVGIRIDTTGGLENVFSDVAIEQSTSYPLEIINCNQLIFDRLYLEGNAQSVNITGGDTISFRDAFNVSATPLIRSTGFAGTKVLVDRMYDLSAGGVGGSAEIMQINQGQITFPSTVLLSSNANTLDDYQEGSWVPSDGSGASLSFTLGQCRYTKIGRLVQANFDITYPSTANGADTVIAGLPFYGEGNAAVNFSYATVAAVVRGMVADGEKYFLIYNSTGGRPVNSDLSGTQIKGSILYETDE